MHVLRPLEGEAVDKEKRLVHACYVDITVEGNHPAIHRYSTPGREGGGEGREGEEEGRGGRRGGMEEGREGGGGVK